jgi:PST family polysaccharide transporter
VIKNDLKFFLSDILKISFTNILFKVLTFIFSLITIPIILKNLGADIYGFLLLVLSYVGYFKLSTLGLKGSMKIEISKIFKECKYNEVNKIISFIQICYIFIFLFFFLITYYFINSNLFLSLSIFNELNISKSSLIVLILSIFVFADIYFKGIYYQAFHGIDKIKEITYFESIYKFFYSIGYLFIALFYCDLFSISLYMMSSVIIEAFLSLLYLKIVYSNFSFNFRFNFFDYLRHFSKSAIWFTFGGIFSVFLNSIEIIFIGTFYSLSSLTMYLLCKKILDIPLSLIPIANSSIPKLTYLYKSNRNDFFNFFIDVFRLNILVKFIIIFPLILFSDYLINIWIGEKFYIGKVAYLLLFYICIFDITCGSLSSALISSDNIKLNSIGSCLQLVVIVCLFIFIYLFDHISLNNIISIILLAKFINFIYLSFIVWKIIDINIIALFKKSSLFILYFASICFLSLLFFEYFFTINQLSDLLFRLIILFLLFFFYFIFLLNHNEKKFINSFLYKYKN